MSELTQSVVFWARLAVVLRQRWWLKSASLGLFRRPEWGSPRRAGRFSIVLWMVPPEIMAAVHGNGEDEPGSRPFPFAKDRQGSQNGALSNGPPLDSRPQKGRAKRL
jgi:hypothetical protein